MKKIAAFSFALVGVGLVGVACHRATASVSQATSPPGPASLAFRLRPPAYAPFMTALQAALRRGDDRSAERMVDDALAGKYRNVGVMDPHFDPVELHVAKAGLLVRRGADAEAVEEYRGLLQGRFGSSVWSPSPHELKPVFMAAVRLRRADVVDAIATRIATESGWQTSDMPALSLDPLRKTLRGRIAYAYLTFAWQAGGDMNYENKVRFCEAARALEPSSAPILARLADAYVSRNHAGDRSLAQMTLRRAYALLPAEGTARRDLRVFGAGQGLDAAPPGARTTLQEDLGAFTAEGPAREAARLARVEREKAAFRARETARRAALAIGKTARRFPALEP